MKLYTMMDTILYLRHLVRKIEGGAAKIKQLMVTFACRSYLFYV
jgi:hypothetical protein